MDSNWPFSSQNWSLHLIRFVSICTVSFEIFIGISCKRTLLQLCNGSLVSMYYIPVETWLYVYFTLMLLQEPWRVSQQLLCSVAKQWHWRDSAVLLRVAFVVLWSALNEENRLCFDGVLVRNLSDDSEGKVLWLEGRAKGRNTSQLSSVLSVFLCSEKEEYTIWWIGNRFK